MGLLYWDGSLPEVRRFKDLASQGHQIECVLNQCRFMGHTYHPAGRADEMAQGGLMVIPRQYPFSNYQEFLVWLDSTETSDKYCFEKAQSGETDTQQITRLEYNLAMFKAYKQNQTKFPKEVYAQRQWEFDRLRELKSTRGMSYG